jgi:hypothetical protein
MGGVSSATPTLRGGPKAEQIDTLPKKFRTVYTWAQTARESDVDVFFAHILVMNKQKPLYSVLSLHVFVNAQRIFAGSRCGKERR